MLVQSRHISFHECKIIIYYITVFNIAFFLPVRFFCSTIVMLRQYRLVTPSNIEPGFVGLNIDWIDDLNNAVINKWHCERIVASDEKLDIIC